jgi:hypothetical protein
MPRLAWITILLFLLPCVAWMTGTHHHAQLLVEMGFHKFLPKLALNHHPPNLHFPSSLDYRLEPLCLVALLYIIFFCLIWV